MQEDALDSVDLVDSSIVLPDPDAMEELLAGKTTQEKGWIREMFAEYAATLERPADAVIGVGANARGMAGGRSRESKSESKSSRGSRMRQGLDVSSSLGLDCNHLSSPNTHAPLCFSCYTPLQDKRVWVRGQTSAGATPASSSSGGGGQDGAATEAADAGVGDGDAAAPAAAATGYTRVGGTGARRSKGHHMYSLPICIHSPCSRTPGTSHRSSNELSTLLSRSR